MCLLIGGCINEHDKERLGGESFSEFVAVHLEVALFALPEPKAPRRLIKLPLQDQGGKVQEAQCDRRLRNAVKILEQEALMNKELELKEVISGLSLVMVGIRCVLQLILYERISI